MSSMPKRISLALQKRSSLATQYIVRLKSNGKHHTPLEDIVRKDLRPYSPYSCNTASACSDESNTRAIFILAAKQPPYNAYGNPFYNFAGHGNVFSTSGGGLHQNIQNYPYSEKSGIHGMVFDPSETHLYSADLQANKIWTHRKDPEDGTLTLVGETDAPDQGDHPRWVELHPSGAYLYVLMEAGNRLAVYVIDERTHLPVFTHVTYPLIPPGTTFFDQPPLPPTRARTAS